MLESELIDNPSNKIVWAFGGIEYSVTFGGNFTQYIAELGGITLMYIVAHFGEQLISSKLMVNIFGWEN